MLIERINADLNDTFGNFIHRTLTFINTQFDGAIPKPETLDADAKKTLETLREKVQTVAEEMEQCHLQSTANTVVSISRIGNQYLNEKEPWNLIKKDKLQAANILYVAAQFVKALAIVSAPFVPFAAEEIWKTLNLAGSVHEQKWDETCKPIPKNHKIAQAKPIFKKIDAKAEELEQRLQKIRERPKTA